jgi:hypothetical protein
MSSTNCPLYPCSLLLTLLREQKNVFCKRGILDLIKYSLFMTIIIRYITFLLHYSLILIHIINSLPSKCKWVMLIIYFLYIVHRRVRTLLPILISWLLEGIKLYIVSCELVNLYLSDYDVRSNAYIILIYLQWT